MTSSLEGSYQLCIVDGAVLTLPHRTHSHLGPTKRQRCQPRPSALKPCLTLWAVFEGEVLFASTR